MQTPQESDTDAKKSSLPRMLLDALKQALKTTFGKVAIAVAVALIIVIIAVASNDPVQDDLIDYVNNDLTEVFELEEQALDLYEKARATDSDYEMFIVLRDEVVPVALEWCEKTKNVEIETKEVKEAHELYIEYTNQFYSAMTMMLSALEEQDYVLVTQANEKIDASDKAGRAFLSALEELAREHDVEID